MKSVLFCMCLFGNAAAISVELGDCSTLKGPMTPEAILSHGNDRLVSLMVATCNQDGCDVESGAGEILCATVGDEDSEVYTNAVSIVHRHLNKVIEQDENVVDRCDGECAAPMNLASRGTADDSSAIWKCLESEDCSYVSYYGSDEKCPNGSCWNMFGRLSNAGANVKTSTGSELFEVLGSFYTKVAVNVDDASTNGRSERECSPLPTPVAKGMTETIAMCDERSDCFGFVIAYLSNVGFQRCLFKAPVTAFSGSKRSSSKIFIKSGSKTIPRLYGYLNYPVGHQPRSTSLQSFNDRSELNEEDCLSICDALPQCEGYVTDGGKCKEIVGMADLNDPIVVQGQFFRKRLSLSDSLSSCEQLQGGCSSDATDTAILIGAGLGAFAVLVVLVMMLTRNRSPSKALTPAEKRLSFGSD